MECFLQEATYDDCGQLLNILFTTEARNRILEATLKLVPGPTEAPTTDPVTINAYFPSNHPDGDYNMAQGHNLISSEAHLYQLAQENYLSSPLEL
ncbi:uncharacterized protein LOC131901160 isoform X4 [Peromyscus eremicus]|uniref:uncharacterized protein LOC131901160 isoform X4 n=1 Tax=Peromyscus eremicus TaxID=42410 RepID=UPI0027DDB29C|nr:uncharacterized protein LOC131901160 isoform X4 [Peromyscus eremicus]